MQYRIHCPQCNTEHILEGLIITSTCPTNSEHSCDKASAVIVSTNDQHEVMRQDYKRQRANLINYVVQSGGSMPVDELMGAAEHFCLPKEVRDMFYTVEEQIEFGKLFHARSIQSRERRYSEVSMQLFNRLTYTQALEVAADLQSGNHVWNYINLGLEGTAVGDPTGVFDYFSSASGTVFSGAGFLEKPWSPLGYTIPELSNKIMDILVSGNY